MEKFEFKSAICTTKEQSERLLALGLKKETADCIWCEVLTLTKGNPIQWYLLAEHINKHDDKHIPAWSLHRLLCLYGADYTIKEVYNNVEECYGMLINAIEIAIEDGHFNKDYLEEKK